MLHYYYNILCIPFVGDNIFDYPDLSWICFCRHWIYTSYDGLCSILGLIYTYIIRVNRECKPTVVVRKNFKFFEWTWWQLKYFKNHIYSEAFSTKWCNIMICFSCYILDVRAQNLGFVIIYFLKNLKLSSIFS